MMSLPVVTTGSDKLEATDGLSGVWRVGQQVDPLAAEIIILSLIATIIFLAHLSINCNALLASVSQSTWEQVWKCGEWGEERKISASLD